jgi:hypothetical protein
MKRSFKSMRAAVAAGALVLALGAGASAQASTTNLAGDMALNTWSTSTDAGSGGYVTKKRSGDIALTSSDNGNNGNTDFFHAITGTGGTLSFDWAYTTNDDAARYDPASYFINGLVTTLADGGDRNLYGSQSLALLAGDTFGWRIYSLDGGGGASVLSVNNILFTANPPRAHWPCSPRAARWYRPALGACRARSAGDDPPARPQERARLIQRFAARRQQGPARPDPAGGNTGGVFVCLSAPNTPIGLCQALK